MTVFYKWFIMFYVFQFSVIMWSNKKGYKFLFMHLFIVRPDSYPDDNEVHSQHSFVTFTVFQYIPVQQSHPVLS